MRSKGLWVMGLAMLGCLFSSVAWAGGAILYEVNSPSTGTASAGWAALAKDASTAFQNPAGMTRLDRSQLQVGVQPVIMTSEFNSGAGTRVMGGGDDGGNAGMVLPSAGGYYVYSASDRFKLGISVLSYFGAALDYGDSWVGRYRVEKEAFITSTFAPSLIGLTTGSPLEPCSILLPPISRVRPPSTTPAHPTDRSPIRIAQPAWEAGSGC